jgi:hypothetical protein
MFGSRDDKDDDGDDIDGDEDAVQLFNQESYS